MNPREQKAFDASWWPQPDGPQRGTAATASLRACLDRKSSIKMIESSVRSLSARGKQGLGFDLSIATSASEGAASGSSDAIKPIHFVPQVRLRLTQRRHHSPSLAPQERTSVSFWTLRARARIT